MKRAVITTTIYRPDNLHDWAQCLREGDIIVVSGDRKTPHHEVEDVLGAIERHLGVTTRYVPNHGGFRSGEAVGWNSIQRRNVATLEAIRLGAEMITSVDTDNFPLDTLYVSAVEQLLTVPWDGQLLCSPTGWLNVCESMTPQVIHRGFPVGQSSSWTTCFRHIINQQRVGVHASLWFGDPDITALERLLYDPISVVIPLYPLALCAETWCPFNSQATTYRRELLPLLCVWPGVGRMDDIWPSYVARYVMNHLGYVTSYGAPNVRQERHPHDVVTDLENEIIGYRYTNAFLAALRSIDISKTTDAVGALEVIFTALNARDDIAFIPDNTRELWFAWLKDLRNLGF